MAIFKVSLYKTLKKEGGYFFSKYDSGKKTRFGITEEIAKLCKFKIENLTRKQAIKIYYELYWKPIRVDKLPQKFADSIFDFSINTGVGGVFIFQQALNIMNTILLKKDELKVLFEELVEDGIFGQKTYNAFAKITKRDRKLLMIWLNYYKAKYYERILIKNNKYNGKQDQKGFSRSWIRRCK